jgi:hypothetical protein
MYAANIEIIAIRKIRSTITHKGKDCFGPPASTGIFFVCTGWETGVDAIYHHHTPC